MGNMKEVFVEGIGTFFDLAAFAGKKAVKNFFKVGSEEAFDIEEAQKTFKREFKKGLKKVADLMLSDEEENIKTGEQQDQKDKTVSHQP